MSNSHLLLGVGIDVSKAQLSVCFRFAEQDEYRQFLNTARGIAQLQQKLGAFCGKIVLESTGRYHLLCALVLSEQGFDVRVINPLLARKYLTARIHNSKTDKADAAVLAEVAVSEKNLPESFCCSLKDIAIRQKLGLLAALEKHVQSFSAMLSGYRECQKQLGIAGTPADEQLSQELKQLRKIQKALEQEIATAVLSQNNSQKHDFLCSVPGISPFVAALILQFLSNACKSPKQWIAYIGLNVLVRQSGTWHGRGRLSHRGNPYLRKRFFGSAWGAVMNHPSFRSYYDALKKDGKNHTEALIVITRKLLRIAFSILKSQQPFSPEIAFSLTTTT